MSKNNITQYPEGELSLLVFNDEYLYSRRHSRYLKETLDEMFIYTPEQWAELQEDLSDDCDEEC